MALANYPEREAFHWSAVVLLFAGARPRELCQTNPQVDFPKESGISYMDLSAKTTSGKGVIKSSKTGEARRILLYAELIRLGFPKYVERIKEQEADRLFPSFRVKAGNAYTANGELFTDLLRAVGLYDDAASPGEPLMGDLIHGCFVGATLVHRDLLGYAVGLYGFLKEPQGCGRVHGPVDVFPNTFDLYISLVRAPTATNLTLVFAQHFLK